MKILVAETAGFCWGVRRALDQAVDLAKKTDDRLFTFGPLIHNTQVMDELAALDRSCFSLEKHVAGRGAPAHCSVCVWHKLGVPSPLAAKRSGRGIAG